MRSKPSHADCKMQEPSKHPIDPEIKAIVRRMMAQGIPLNEIEAWLDQADLQAEIAKAKSAKRKDERKKRQKKSLRTATTLN